MSALLLRVGGTARVAPTAMLAWIGVLLRLVIGRAGLLLRLVVGWARPSLRLRPLEGRCKIPFVSVPVAITLPHRGVVEGSRVRSIRRPIIELVVRTIVGIAILMPVGVTCQNVLEMVDDDDPKHDPDNRRCDNDDRRGREIVACVWPVFRTVVILVVFAVLGIPIVDTVRAVHE